jgi:hypothetical protein
MDIFPTRVVIAVSDGWVWALPILAVVGLGAWKFGKILVLALRG